MPKPKRQLRASIILVGHEGSDTVEFYVEFHPRLQKKDAGCPYKTTPLLAIVGPLVEGAQRCINIINSTRSLSNGDENETATVHH